MSKQLIACVCVMTAISLAGCEGGGRDASSPAAGTANQPAAARPEAAAGAEKTRPAPGKGNVQGRVLYNGKPVENIEVKLCEKFSQFLGGCSGETYTARTGQDGVYVIADVAPKVYEGLVARVFDTDSYVFATSGIGGISATTYEVAADKTLFVEPTHLFKGDLKVVNPKAGSKVSAQNLELRWEPYPDAAYYKFSIFPEDAGASAPYINERVDGTSFAVDKPLQRGTYRWQVVAYNGADQRLSESSRDIKFTVTNGAAPQ